MYEQGRTVRAPLISLKYNERRKPGYRAAVVVSRKVHKSAVTRNRIRRRIYEIIRCADPELTSQKDMIFTVFSDKTAELEAPKLKVAVEELLKRSN